MGRPRKEEDTPLELRNELADTQSAERKVL